MEGWTIFNFMYIFCLTKHHKTMKEWEKLLQIEPEVCFYIIFEESAES